MMRNHVVSGWDVYEQNLWALRLLGVEYTEYQVGLKTLYVGRAEENELRKTGCGPARLRKACFLHPITKCTIFIEEYAAHSYSDQIGGVHRTLIDVVRYREGERPELDRWTKYYGPDEQDQVA